MERKVLYSEIKKFNLEETIKKQCGKNYTQVSNAVLEEFVKTAKFKEAADTAKAKSPIKDNLKQAILKLLIRLQTKRVISATEAEEVAKLL